MTLTHCFKPHILPSSHPSFCATDRKAFFAVVSLLIDPSRVPESVRLTEENFEQYLPHAHKKLVDVMKA